MLFSIFNGMPPDPGWNPPLPRGGGSWMYPICIILGFAVAITLGCLKLWKRYKVSVEPFYWFILIGVPTAILGARFGSCAIGQTPWEEFFHNFGQGLAIEWGVMLTVLVAFIYFPLILKRPRYRVRDYFGKEEKVKRVSMWMYFDAIVPAILIAQFIGRWGNYCNQEVYGRIVTDENLAWFLYKVLPGMYINGEWRQPLFFWEGIGNLCMFFILYFGVEFISKRKTGDLAGCYFVWYGTFRASLEPLRDDQFGFKVSIITSIVWAIIGILFILVNHLLISKVRNKKIWHTLFGFGPGKVFQMIGNEWNDSIIQNKKDKLEEIKFKNKNLDESNQKNSEKISKLEEFIEKKSQVLKNKLQKQKDKRAADILEFHNETLRKMENKYTKVSQKLSKKMESVSDAKREKVKQKYDKILKEINNEIVALKQTDISQKQAAFEMEYQKCTRLEAEKIYFGAW